MIMAMMILVIAAAFFLIKPASRPATLKDALTFHEKGDYEAAFKLLEQLKTRQPNDQGIRMLLAQTALELETPRIDQALKEVDAVLPLVRSPQAQAVWKTVQGKAWVIEKQNAKAEAALLEARRLDPKVAEAGWLLIQLYYQQGRQAENRDLILELHGIEPDPIDRVRLILEPLRQEAQPLAAAGVIPFLESSIKNDLEDWRSLIALGAAQVKDGRTEEGLKILKEVVDRSPNLDSWVAYLAGLDDGGEHSRIVEEFAKIPADLAKHPRMLPFQARIAQEKKDFPAAASALEQAVQTQPDNLKLRYRLARLLQQMGRSADYKRHEELHDEQKKALAEQKTIYESISKGDSQTLTPALMRRIAEIRDLLGQTRESEIWRAIALERESQSQGQGQSQAVIKSDVGS